MAELFNRNKVASKGLHNYIQRMLKAKDKREVLKLLRDYAPITNKAQRLILGLKPNYFNVFMMQRVEYYTNKHVSDEMVMLREVFVPELLEQIKEIAVKENRNEEKLVKNYILGKNIKSKPYVKEK